MLPVNVAVVVSLVCALVPGGAWSASRQAAGRSNLSGVIAFGEYRFGMTRDQVRAVTSCAPYRVVAGTNGLECPNLLLGSQTMNISFVFANIGLSRVQLWFYEGTSQVAAEQATESMIAYLSRTGPVRSNELPGGTRPTSKAVFGKLRQLNGSKQGARVQILTPPAPEPPYVHGSITQVGKVYYVFLFFTATT